MKINFENCILLYCFNYFQKEDGFVPGPVFEGPSSFIPVKEVSLILLLLLLYRALARDVTLLLRNNNDYFRVAKSALACDCSLSCY